MSWDEFEDDAEGYDKRLPSTFYVKGMIIVVIVRGGLLLLFGLVMITVLITAGVIGVILGVIAARNWIINRRQSKHRRRVRLS